MPGAALRSGGGAFRSTAGSEGGACGRTCGRGCAGMPWAGLCWNALGEVAGHAQSRGWKARTRRVSPTLLGVAAGEGAPRLDGHRGPYRWKVRTEASGLAAGGDVCRYCFCIRLT